MKSLKFTALASILMVMLSTTALAGNIGMRATGNIGMRTTGNIGMRGAGKVSPATSSLGMTPSTTRNDFETDISGTFAGLIRMLLESGALL